MPREEWERLERVLERALEVAAPDRDAFLARTCGEDAALLLSARRALGMGGTEDDFLERPFGTLVSGLLREVAGEAGSGARPDAETDDGRSTGRRIGPYRLLREIGRGGMGTVYLAERDDDRFDRRVAVKLVRPGVLAGEFRSRFLLEQRILASLEHPHIARLYDAGIDEDGTPYIVMEFVEGRPIDEHCTTLEVPVDERLRLFDQVCDAVEFAHRKLVVHRDLKPGNVLVSDGGVVKLLDFGIAKLLADDERSAGSLTVAGGARAFTPEYASPEQLRGEPVSTATDVYALGVLLYDLLTGSWPYRAADGSPRAIERAVLEQEALRPSAAAASRSAQGLARRLRGDLDDIVLMALRKEPERRYASVTELRDDLRRHLERRPVRARPDTWTYRAGRFAWRHRAGVAAATVVIVSLLAGLAGTAWQARAASRQAMRADRVRSFVVELFQVSDPDRSRGESISARTLLDRGAEQLRTNLGAEPETRAEMLNVLGDIYAKLGLYDRARPLLEEALSEHTRLRGPDDLAVARSASSLSALLLEQGEYERAEVLARRALDVRRRRRGSSDTLVAASMGDLAAVLDHRGRLRDAEDLYRSALAIDQSLGARAAAATDLSSLAVALWREGRYDEALVPSEQALRLRRELDGPEHTLVATDLFNLATIEMARGEFDRAEELFTACLDMRRRLLGDRHPYVALTLNNLGELYQKRGRLEDAERAHREALEIRRDVLGDDHPEVATSLNDLGVVLYFEGDREGAAEQFRRALAIWRRTLGDTHPRVLTGLNNLGAALREAGDLAAAESPLREVLELRRKTLGPDHPDVAQSLNNLAELLLLKRDYDEAEKDFRSALAIWRKALGAEHPTTAYALDGLGRLLAARGRCAEAEAPLSEGLAIRVAKLDEGSTLIAGTRLALGRCLVELGRYQEAEPLLLAGYPVIREARGDEADLTRRARQALVELYTAWGRPAEARRYGAPVAGDGTRS